VSGFAGPGKKPDEFGKVPGKESGVTADDFAHGNAAPGKKNIFQTYDIGVAYADKGPRCEASGGSSPGCFMSAGQRGRLIQLAIDRVSSLAQTNYKLALTQLKVDQLIKKDDDLGWVISLLLDLATSHLAGMASKALSKLKASSIRDASDFGLGLDVIGDEDSSWIGKGGDMLRSVSDKTIEGVAKKGFDGAKKVVSKAMKDDKNEAAKSEKAATVSYIDYLETECDVAFDAFKQHAFAEMDDSQLIVMYNGLAPQFHGIPQYKAALTEKIARYKKSGVADIGQKAIGPAEQHVAQLYASKRAIKVREPSGATSVWMYRVISSNQDDPWMDVNADFERVPDEFTEAALSLSEQKWGPIITIDDPVAKKPLPRLQLRDSSQRKTS
jgi:hypothetical protein